MDADSRAYWEAKGLRFGQPSTACENFPDWQGCECQGADDHDGPHTCVCGARWDEEGHPLGVDGEPTGLDLPRREDNEAVLARARPDQAG